MFRWKAEENIDDEGYKNFIALHNALVDCVEYTYETSFDMARDNLEDEWINDLAKSAAIARAWLERMDKALLGK